MSQRQLSHFLAEVKRPNERIVDGDNVLVIPKKAFDKTGAVIPMNEAMQNFPRKPWKEGKLWNVRLSNIDAPELHEATGYENNQKVKFNGQGRYGKEAAEKLAALLPDGSEVILEFDKNMAGTSGRPLAHVFSVTNNHKGQYINKEMAASGLVLPYFIAPLGKYVSEMREAARQADEGDRGIYPHLIYDRFIVRPSELNAGEQLNEPFIFRRLKNFITKRDDRVINPSDLERKTRWLHDNRTNKVHTYRSINEIPPYARTWYEKGTDIEALRMEFNMGDTGPIPSHMLQYTPFGAAGQVSGSKHLFELKTDNGVTGLLIDCGLDHTQPMTDDEIAQLAEKTSSVILTHAHLDHFGDLYRLLDCNPYIKVFCTYGTYRIIFDTATRPGVWPRVCAYKGYEQNFNIYPYYKTFSVDEDIKVQFYCAGHMPGSAQVSIEFRLQNNKKKNGFISGDIGPFFDLPIIKTPDKDLPREPDFMLCESTYGVENRSNGDPSLVDMLKKTNYAITNRKKIICAAFSVMRTQSILLDLYKLKKNGMLPASYKIGLHASETSSSFKLNNYMSSWLTGNINLPGECNSAGYAYELLDPATIWEFRTGDIFKSFQLVRNPDQADFVIVADGMWNYGRAQKALEKYANDGSVIFMLAGYQAGQSNGRQLQNAMEERRMKNEPADSPKKIVVKSYNSSNEVDTEKQITLQAEVMKLKGYMSHIDGPSRISYVDKVSPKKLFLVHGDADSLKAVKKDIEGADCMDGEIVIPEKRMIYGI